MALCFNEMKNGSTREGLQRPAHAGGVTDSGKPGPATGRDTPEERKKCS